MAHSRRKKAIITGATGGMGAAISAVLIDEGMEVVMLGRNAEKLPVELMALVNSGDNQARFITSDFDSEKELKHCLQQLQMEEEVDYLFHCAALYSYGSVLKMDEEGLDKSYRVNVRAPYKLTRNLLPALIRSKGCIVFLNSSVVHGAGKGNLSHYTATKAALKAFADSLRQEINAEGVKVLTVTLGKTATGMQKIACEKEGLPWLPDKMIDPGEAAKMIVAAVTEKPSLEVTDLNIRPAVKYE